MTTPSGPDVPALRGEMTALSLFGGRLALSELILFSLFLTDFLMLGLISELSLSAALLVNSCFVPCFVTALGLLQGGLPLAARHYGDGDVTGFHGVTGATLVLALICYIAVRNAIIATGNSRGFILLSVAGLILNGCMNYLLGFGLTIGTFSTPAMGISGIGLASTIVEGMIFAGFTLLLFRRGFRLHHLSPVPGLRNLWTAIRPYMRQTTRIGLAVALIFFVDSTLFSGVLIMVGRHDVQGMAALALIFEWVALAVMIPVGLSEAIVQRVAQAQSQFSPAGQTGNDDISARMYQTGDSGAAAALPSALRMILRAAFMVTSLYLLGIAVIYIGLGINVPTLFILDNDAHPAIVARLERYAIPGLLLAIFMSFIIVFAAILRGLLDVRTSMIAVVICYWGIGLGVTFVLVEFFDCGADEALKTVNIALGIGTATLVARLWFLLGRSRQ